MRQRQGLRRACSEGGLAEASHDDYRNDGQGPAREDRRRHDGLQGGAQRDRWRHGGRGRLAQDQGPCQGGQEIRPGRGRGADRTCRRGQAGGVGGGQLETDFVARNQKFKEMVGAIGENMTLRRTAYLAVTKGAVASYLHNTIAPGLGKIGVIVALESSGNADKLKSFGKQVAMHIAAANPQSIDVGSLDPAFVERERGILTEQAKESGKPAQVIEKMVEGRLRKFHEEVVLSSQAFVHDPDTTVAKALEATEKEIGAPIKITGFYRFALGEGIDRPDSDF